jgi:hypothetical protein
MHAALKRDIANAKSHSFILGIKISGRHDVFCEKKATFCGVYLPDALPDLYPADCPNEGACNCINREFVMEGDGSLEELQLRERIAGEVPVKVDFPSAVVAVASTVEDDKSDTFTYAEVRVLRKLLQVTGPFIWDEKGVWTYEAGYPSERLLARLIENGWVREATLQEKLTKLTTIPKLTDICKQQGLPRSGDKQMLVDRVATGALDLAETLVAGLRLAVVTDDGKKNLGLQSGQARERELGLDFEQREQSYQKLVYYAQHVRGAKIQVTVNSWSSCEKSLQFVGIYDPDKAPALPPGDCPMTGMKPCSCWNATIIESAQMEPEPLVVLQNDPVDVVVKTIPKSNVWRTAFIALVVALVVAVLMSVVKR